MLKSTKTTIAGIATAAMLAASSFAIVPAAQADSGLTAGAQVEQIRFEGPPNRGNWHGGGHWDNGRWIGPAAGFGAGVVIGSLLAQPRYYAPARPVYGDSWCAQRYQSYDPASGTYLGYDGYRHPCP